MVEILEKLPGITVERYALLNRSHTFAGHEVTSSKHPTLADQDNISSVFEPYRHSACKLNMAKRERIRSRLSYQPPSRCKAETSHFGTPSRTNTKMVDLEILGKSTKTGDALTTQISCPTERNIIEESEDTLPQESPPILKSILKRTGSGISTRSSRSLGVMSADSGMTRLSASLFSNKTSKSDSSQSSSSGNHLQKRPVRRNRYNIPPELSALPILGTRSGIYTSREVQTNDAADDSAGVTSPSKSVTFKLEPDFRCKEDDQAGNLLRKRGDARWRVALSFHQEKIRDRNPNRNSMTSNARSNGKTTNDKTTSQLNRDFQEKLSMKRFVESTGISTTLRPRGGISGVTGIHLMSDPYRRYLMVRAAEQSDHFASEHNPVREAAIKVKAASQIEESANHERGMSREKSYVIKSGRPDKISTINSAKQTRSQKRYSRF